MKLTIWDKIIAGLVLLTVLGAIALFSGCTASAPFRWQPTEVQKQAADLAVQDVAALRGAVNPGHEPIRQEAEAASRTTQAYLGLPEQRLAPVQPDNDAVIITAQQDANRDQPSIADVAGHGMDTADTILTILGSIAGTAGFGIAGKKVLNVRNTLRSQREAIVEHATDSDQRAQAIRELVRNIQTIKDELLVPNGCDDEVREILCNQSPLTKQFVSAVKATDAKN